MSAQDLECRNGNSPSKGIETSSVDSSVDCRNGNSPSKGIETQRVFSKKTIFFVVEMGIARVRALKQLLRKSASVSSLTVEMGIARVRALLCSLSNDHRLLQTKIF